MGVSENSNEKRRTAIKCLRIASDCKEQVHKSGEGWWFVRFWREVDVKGERPRERERARFVGTFFESGEAEGMGRGGKGDPSNLVMTDGMVRWKAESGGFVRGLWRVEVLKGGWVV